MGDPAVAFTANLRRLRSEHGLLQKELAEKAGVSTSAVSVIENGIHAPSLYSACALARALGTTVDAMCTEAGDGRG